MFVSEPAAPLKRDLLATLSHPDFAAASFEYRKDRVRSANKKTNQIDYSKLSTTLIALITLYFHYHRILNLRKPSRRILPPNALAAIKSIANNAAITSGRHVNSLVARMEDIGLLVRRTGTEDLRTRQLIPTEAMIESALEEAMSLFTPMMKLGLPQASVDLLREDEFVQAVFFTSLVRAWMVQQNPVLGVRHVPDLMMKARAVSLVLEVIVDTKTLHGCMYAERPVPLNGHALSKKYGVSRAHVASVFHALERKNLVTLDRDRHTVTLSQDLCLALDCSLAATFVALRKCLASAIAAAETANKSVPKISQWPLGL